MPVLNVPREGTRAPRRGLSREGAAGYPDRVTAEITRSRTSESISMR